MVEKKLRVAVYIRVATLAQAGSIDVESAQKAHALSYCAANGLQVSAIYSDIGFPGTTMDRPELKRLLADIGRYDLLLVNKMDRLARGTENLLPLLHELVDERGVRVVSLLDGFDSDSASSRMLMTVMRTVAAGVDEHD